MNKCNYKSLWQHVTFLSGCRITWHKHWGLTKFMLFSSYSSFSFFATVLQTIKTILCVLHYQEWFRNKIKLPFTAASIPLSTQCYQASSTNKANGVTQPLDIYNLDYAYKIIMHIVIIKLCTCNFTSQYILHVTQRRMIVPWWVWRTWWIGVRRTRRWRTWTRRHRTNNIIHSKCYNVWLDNAAVCDLTKK